MILKIDKYDDLGNGIAKINNKVCFIKRSIPNEIVKIKIIKDNKKYSVGLIEKIIEKSSSRVDNVCKYYDKCGGCDFLHLNQEEEIKFKINRTKIYFKHLNNFYKTYEYNYRNKISLHVKNGEIGLYNSKSNDLIKIDYCYLCKEKINDVLKILINKKDTKFNGNIIIRVNSKDQIMLVINGNYKYINNLVDEKLINNIVYNNEIVKGNDYFIEEVLDYKFKVNYNSFFQVNNLGLIKIIELLTSFVKNNDIDSALDLYSGTSVLGIIISKYVKRVVSIESNSYATNDALYNLKINNINNLEVINGLVENNIDKFKNIDLVLVDPSRKGLDKKTIDYLNKIKSRYIIYIACGIDALKRDLELLTNYNIDKLDVIDMFPNTTHVETVCLLCRKTIDK